MSAQPGDIAFRPDAQDGFTKEVGTLAPHGSESSDESLMVRVQGGDKNAFAQLYDRHAAQAFQVARTTCPDSGRAEDAVREGFKAIWHGREHFDPARTSFRAWAMVVVSNRAIDAERTLDQVIALAYFGELSHTEIASHLDLPAATVKGRMRLGLEKLRRQMSVPG